MTRKDYELIAKTISEIPTFLLASPVKTSRLVIARRFANQLVSTNPNFDRERFIAAATGEGEL